MLIQQVKCCPMLSPLGMFEVNKGSMLTVRFTQLNITITYVKKRPFESIFGMQ